MKIYKTTNLINNKIYIGQSNENRKDYLGGTILLKAIKKYGKNNFKMETIISGNFNKELINELEKHFIRLFNSNNRLIGYNIQNGGTSYGGHSLETISKIKKSLTGKTMSLASRLKSSNSKKGKPAKNRRKVLNTITGFIYDSVTIAEFENDLTYRTLARMLTGKRKNNTNLIYI